MKQAKGTKSRLALNRAKKMLPRVMRIAASKPSLFRLLLIMSFAEKPGMIGSVHCTRELYGRIT